MSTGNREELIDFPVERTDPFMLPPIYAELRRDHPFHKVRNRVDGTEPWLITGYENCR